MTDLNDCDGVLETSPEPIEAIEKAVINETPNDEYDRLLKLFNHNVITINAYGTELTVTGIPIGIVTYPVGEENPIQYDIFAKGERVLSRSDSQLLRIGESVHVEIERYWNFEKEPGTGIVVDKFTFTWRKRGFVPLVYKTSTKEYTFNQAFENLLDMRDIAQRIYD